MPCIRLYQVHRSTVVIEICMEIRNVLQNCIAILGTFRFPQVEMFSKRSLCGSDWPSDGDLERTVLCMYDGM